MGCEGQEKRDCGKRLARDRHKLVELSKALVDLDEMLRQKASGFSLEPLYAEVPEILQGYVELVYDLNNQPSFRLIESLLYRSPFYDPAMQSVVLSEISQDDRPFVLSTPRLPKGYALPFTFPFSTPHHDFLFRLKETPATFAEIQKTLELNG